MTAKPGNKTVTVKGAAGGVATFTGLADGTTYTFTAVAHAKGTDSPASR